MIIHKAYNDNQNVVANIVIDYWWGVVSFYLITVYLHVHSRVFSSIAKLIENFLLWSVASMLVKMIVIMCSIKVEQGHRILAGV